MEVIFCSGSSSVIRAYPAFLKLALVFSTYCRFGSGCLSQSPHALSNDLLMASKLDMSSWSIFAGLSDFLSSWNGAIFSDYRGI